VKTKPAAPKNIDEYIAAYPNDVQAILQKIRLTIRKAAPKAEETLSYKMPTFTLKGKYLVWFAAFKKHIGFYPAPNGVAEFNEALATYGAARSTLKFPLDEPIPYDLIRKIVKFRAKEDMGRPVAKEKQG
jgi:uncharacterized protein YdhG (YjbR/CyaY superfamily)